MDLTRGGGPGDLEQQRQQEMQQQLEREQRITEQTPQVMAQLNKELDQHPTLGPQLKQYSREQQDEIKKALTDGITDRIGRNGLQRIDAIGPLKNGGIAVRFNGNRVAYLEGGQMPTLADGSRPIKIGEPARPAMPEQPSAQERQSPSREPAQQRTEPERAPPSQRDRASTEPQRPAQERTLPAPGEYTSLSNLTQRQQQTRQGIPLDDRHVAKPHFENGILVVKPIPYTNPFSPQPISHEPQQRQADIQTLLEPKLGNALDGYNPAQQNQLKQALTEEISDITGSSLKIDHIEKLDDGRLSIQLNQGLHQIYLDPQQVLQPERETPPAREPLSPDEQTRQETQRQIQQQVEQFSQLQPFERIAIENRLREAVGDERIESLRIEGEDTIQLGLRNGMVLTASTYELLNMADGRELLQRSQVDPTAQNSQTSQNSESGLNHPDGQPDRSLPQQPIAFTVLDGEGPARIGKRIAPDNPDAAAWYVLQSLTENYGDGQRGIHYSPGANRLIIKEGQQGSIDLSSKSDAELTQAAQDFRLYMAKEGKEDRRREDVEAKSAERQRQQAEQAKADRDLLQQQYAREHSVVFLHNQSAERQHTAPSSNPFSTLINRAQPQPYSPYSPLTGPIRLPLGSLPETPEPDRRGLAEQGRDWLDKHTQPYIKAYQQSEKDLANFLRVDANDNSASAHAKRFAASQLGGLSGLGEWGGDIALGGAKLVSQGGDAILDSELIKLDRLSGGLLGRNVDYVRDAHWRQQQRLDTVQGLGTQAGQLTVQGYRGIGKLYQQYQADPEQFKGDVTAASRLAADDVREAAERRWQQSKQGYQTADLYQAQKDAKLAAEAISIVVPAVGAGVKGVKGINAAETVVNAGRDANKAAKAAHVLTESLDLGKDAHTAERTLELSRGGRTLRQPEKALAHSDDALRPAAQQQALNRAERLREELDRSTLEALKKQGDAVQAEKQALELGSKQAKLQAEEARKVADQALQRTADMTTLQRAEQPIIFTKAEAPANSYRRSGWDMARQEADLSAGQFHDLNLTPVEMWTEREAAQMKLVRDRVPVPGRNTEMRKVIPEDSIEKIMSGHYDSKVGGYVAKADDVSHLKTYGEVKETFRLDYRDTTFTEGKDTYGLIKYKVEKPEKIEVPYDKRLGGNTRNPAPCTRNGFLASRNGEVVPEWYAPRELPQDGAELYRVRDGIEELVGVFDDRKGVKRFVRPEEYGAN